MKCYIAVIVYRIFCGEGNHTAQFDEQLRLIFATNFNHALEKAKDIGLNEEDNCYKDPGKPVQWKFINIKELFLVNEWIDGAEIYSSIQETDDAENHIQSLHARTQILETQIAAENFQLN